MSESQAATKYVIELRKDIKQLREDNERLREDNEQLREDIERLRGLLRNCVPYIFRPYAQPPRFDEMVEKIKKEVGDE